jgi:uncharacterized protein (TIGR02996 family)
LLHRSALHKLEVDQEAGSGSPAAQVAAEGNGLVGTEDALVAEIPSDFRAILVLADYLEEQGDLRGELLRLVFAATRSPDAANEDRCGPRMRQLLLAGVNPVGPYLDVPLGRCRPLTFAWVPPGAFLMGSPPDEALAGAAACNDDMPHIQEPDYCREELPRHPVVLTRGFWMGVCPVTQSQWTAVLGDNPSRFRGRKRPVEQVSWTEAQHFCDRLSSLLRERGMAWRCRLPKEAEWEYACRAGTTTAFFWGNSLPAQQARFCKDWVLEPRPTSPVGKYPPNAWGLHDLHGNVWEWTADWYGQDYYHQSPGTDPQGPTEGDHHVLRGGSASVLAHECRSAIRGEAVDDAPDLRGLERFAVLGDFGVRLVCEPTG